MRPLDEAHEECNAGPGVKGEPMAIASPSAANDSPESSEVSEDGWTNETYLTIGPALLDLVLTRRTWVHRRVDHIEFIDDVRVRRSVSVDFTLPRWQKYKDAISVLPSGFCLVPVALPRKGLLRGFDVRDEAGSALPVLTKRQTQRLGILLLIGRAVVVKKEKAIREDLDVNTETELAKLVLEDSPSKAGQSYEQLLGAYKKSSSALLRALATDDVLPALMADLAKHFILCAVLRAAPGERRIIKFSYEEYLRLRTPARRLGWISGTNIRGLLGWGPVEFDAQVTVGVSESSHVEIPTPNELFLERAELLGPFEADEPRGELGDGPAERAHLHGSFSRARDCDLELSIRLQPGGIVTAALLTCLLVVAFLGGGLVARITWNAQPVGEVPALILLAIPGLFAAYFFTPGRHRLLRKAFAGLQAVVLGLATLSLLAAALIAVKSPPIGRLGPWFALTLLSVVALVIVWVARSRSKFAARGLGTSLSQPEQTAHDSAGQPRPREGLKNPFSPAKDAEAQYQPQPVYQGGFRSTILRALSCIPAGIFRTFWLLPWFIALSAVITVIMGRQLALMPSGLAGGVSVVLWFLIALLVSGTATADRANPSSYGELRNRLVSLRARHSLLCENGRGPGKQAAACREAQAHLYSVETLLATVGLPWVNGTGYIAAWEGIHRAEEALIGAEEAEELDQEVQHDKLRLHGAALPNAEDLRHLLSAAEDFLCRSSGGSWRHLRALVCGHHRNRQRERDCITGLPVARRVLREVRFNVNDFRDSSWNGLLQLRNQTIAAQLLTEFAALGLLAFAVVTGAPSAAVIGGAVLFVVAATVGLFSHLYQLSQADTAIEDYGLSTARLLTLPVYAGLAGVGGVLLSSLTLTQGPVGATLAQALNLQNNPQGLVVAAVFGVQACCFGGSMKRRSGATRMTSRAPRQPTEQGWKVARG
jgi:hypothetical protein